MIHLILQIMLQHKYHPPWNKLPCNFLVLGMLALALLNRLRIERCEQRLGSLKSSVMLEWLLGVAAVAAVSLLGTLPPMVMAA